MELAKAARQDDWDAQDKISSQSDRVADQLSAVVAALKQLPGQANLEEEGSMGAEVVEALEAALATSEEQAGRFPTSVAVGDLDAGLAEGDVAAIVVNAARAIGHSTVNVVRAALATQQELVAKGRLNSRLDVYRKDPAWAAGLMRTAEGVTAKNEAFVAAVHAVAEAEGDDELADLLEQLVEASTASGEKTQRLVASSKAKADPNALSSKKLTAAGKAVDDATQALLAAARTALQRMREAKEMDTGVVPFEDRLQDGELREMLAIAKLERQLEEARLQARLRKKNAEGAAMGAFVTNPMARRG